MASSTSPLIMRILAASVSVTQRSGKIIRDIIKSGDLGIVDKGKNDLQTEADRSVQRCIIASLQKAFPKVTIQGEETQDPNDVVPDDYIVSDQDADVLKQKCPEVYQNVTDDQIVIWVDPLDGTAEFTQGLLDHVTVLIGIAINGESKAGVIYQPYYNYEDGADAAMGRCIWGLVGLGAFGYTKNSPPEGQNLITTTRSHSDAIVTESVEACEPTEVVRVGGAGHKVLLLVEGKVHAYVFASKGCKKWDTCAPEAVLHAIGGSLTDMVGKPILYHRHVNHRNAGGVLATVKNHNWYLGKIPQTIKDTFVSDEPSEEMKMAAGGDSQKTRHDSSVDPPKFK